MKTEKIEDKVIFDIPVYLSKTIAQKLYLFQYPVRPQFSNYDNENVQKARVKPNSGQVEMEVGLRTRAPTFDRSKGEQIALNVDGANRGQKDSQENYYASNTMDKIILSSNKVLTDVKSYAVGVIADGALHISPVASMLDIKPAFSYLDMADKRSKLDQNYAEESESEEITKKVTVRFERPETDRSRDMKEKSYAYLQKKMREEPWIPVEYYKFGSERSEFESQHLFCSHQNEVIDQFTLDSESYLNVLIPRVSDSAATSNPAASQGQLSGTSIKDLSLQDRLKFIIQNAGVASFTELVSAISSSSSCSSSKEDPSSILKAVQQIAVLVQGNWVVKSDILFPKDVSSESEASNEVLQKVRDYILYLFTKNLTITRSNVTDTMEVSAQDLTKLFGGVAVNKGSRGTWDFMLPPDNTFLKIYPDVSQRQQMIWQSRHEQLSRHFKIK